jgi:hypothetical protein
MTVTVSLVTTPAVPCHLGPVLGAHARKHAREIAIRTIFSVDTVFLSGSIFG